MKEKPRSRTPSVGKFGRLRGELKEGGGVPVKEGKEALREEGNVFGYVANSYRGRRKRPADCHDARQASERFGREEKRTSTLRGKKYLEGYASGAYSLLHK